jgi:hypothetical protein
MATWLYNRVKHIPAVKQKVEKEFETLINELEGVVKPYRGQFDTCAEIPDTGRDKSDILKDMQALSELEQAKWKDGYASGAVYHGDEAHIQFLNQIYALNSQSNPLHSDLWPSSAKYESEIVRSRYGAGRIGSGSGNLRGGIIGRHRKYSAGNENLPGLGAGSKKDHPARDDRSGYRPCRL